MVDCLSNDGRLSWIKDGLDEKDRIQKRDLRERIGKENDITRKERDRVQNDEQKRINLYSEGMCYRCNKIDKVISSLFYVCKECLEKKGSEALLNIVMQKRNVWELCDFHEAWVFHEVCQINCSLCDTCMSRVKRLHKAYKRAGGRASSPDVMRRKRIYGKDYNYLLGKVYSRK